MSIQSEIISALAGVAGDRVFPDSTPESVPAPMVVVKRIGFEPLNVLTGTTGLAKSTFLFTCWGSRLDEPRKKGAKTIALETAAAVRLAVYGGTSGSPFSTFFEEAVSGEDFEPETLEVMEPVSFSFWHSV